ncbi:MAG: hypothetical protein CVU84_03675 [Firmicutes bacterium HGW-Firmicutes-1]|jgi:predicted transcriptional regulator|nr:MAG: hypothetical protein CVU84_03675 [Firmicutes bacterium HGW-Firmicutes-1]
MVVKDIVEKIDFKVLSGQELLDNEIKSGFVGDLLSVVMGKAKEGCAWITIQGHLNIVAVASLVGVACIIVSEGFEVEPDTIEKANEEEIPILSTTMSSYQVAVQLTKLGIA